MFLIRKVKELFTSQNDSYMKDGNDSHSGVKFPVQAMMKMGWMPPEEPDYDGYNFNEFGNRFIYKGMDLLIGIRPRISYGKDLSGGSGHHSLEEDGSAISPEIHLYTDGSFYKKKSGYGIYAPCYDEMNRSVRLDAPHSIDRAEIQAIIQALLHIAINMKSQFNEHKTVIFTDSATTIYALHQVRGEREGWKLPKTPQNLKDKISNIKEMYREELLILLTLAERFSEVITISHVNSHIGIPGNEWADLFAKISTMTIRGALKSKTIDHERKSDRLWPLSLCFPTPCVCAPFITIKPSTATKNRSLLLLDIDDRSNSILYPGQQIVWDIHRSPPFRKLFEEMSIFAVCTYETWSQLQFQFY